jgi:cell division protein FtsB
VNDHMVSDMETPSRPRSRFQYSVGTLTMMVAVLAVLLAPVAWMARERQLMTLRARAAQRAQAQALRALALQRANPVGGRVARPAAQPVQSAAAGSDRIEQLQQENTELRETVESLRRELERLKAAGHP